MSNERRLEQLTDKIRDARALVDDIDATSFGRVEALFDQIAKTLDAAAVIADELSYEIDWEAA